VHGRGGSGKGEIEQWIGFAKELGFIVACPDMCSATDNRPPTSPLAPLVEDEEVLLSVFDEVRGRFRVNRRAVMLTGHSGGGLPAFHTGLRHPGLITHLCARSANFYPVLVPADEQVLAAGRARLKVHIYYGERDHPLILGEDGRPGQARSSFDALKAAGYESVEIERIAGMVHESRADIAAGWFGAFLAANRRTFAAWDKADDLLAVFEEHLASGEWRDAVEDLLALEKYELRNALTPVSTEPRARLLAVAGGFLEEAKKLSAAGHRSEALGILSRVKRDFQGLPPCEAARELERQWGVPTSK
jgi:pimeloyl-ACP methyl ester carboxylesterase